PAARVRAVGRRSRRHARPDADGRPNAWRRRGRSGNESAGSATWALLLLTLPDVGESSQQVLDRLTHAVQLVRRHVRIQRKCQRLSAGNYRSVQAIAAATRNSLKQRLVVQRGIEVSLRLDALRFQL